MTRARWIALAAIVVAILFALEEGTYNERNYLALQQAVRDSAQRVTVLQHAVDSLGALRDSIENDPVVQERIARDGLGMVRPGELMFMIQKDSAVKVPPTR
ncbi:MAG TPA: septum formation initiator family protein [Gemmatimonadales bacterium]